jgi:hypothetical protein
MATAHKNKTIEKLEWTEDQVALVSMITKTFEPVLEAVMDASLNYKIVPQPPESLSCTVDGNPTLCIWIGHYNKNTEMWTWTDGKIRQLQFIQLQRYDIPARVKTELQALFFTDDEISIPKKYRNIIACILMMCNAAFHIIGFEADPAQVSAAEEKTKSLLQIPNETQKEEMTCAGLEVIKQSRISIMVRKWMHIKKLQTAETFAVDSIFALMQMWNLCATVRSAEVTRAQTSEQNS